MEVLNGLRYSYALKGGAHEERLMRTWLTER
jgi:hypothetical protein